MFSNVNVLLLDQRLCCKTSTSIHLILNSCFHLQTCWIIVDPAPYTHANNSCISSDVYFSVVKKRITLHNSDWMYVAPCLQTNLMSHSTIHHQILTVCFQTQTLNYLQVSFQSMLCSASTGEGKLTFEMRLVNRHDKNENDYDTTVG